MDIQEKYRALINIIYKKGKKFPKKHGNWIKLDLFKDYYLSLDSWNGCILFNKGNANYNEWTGFGHNGEDFSISCLGGDFGGFRKPDDENTLDWILFDVLKFNT